MSDINVFSEQTPPNPLDALVGEGRKYKSVEDLAKAVEFKEQHINQIEAENAQYRANLQEQIELQRQRSQEAPPPPQSGQGQSEVDLEQRIRNTLEQTDREKRVATNVNEVSQKLVDVYGTPEKANEVVKQKAAELGVSIQFLMDSAAQSPKAFYAQIGLNEGNRHAASINGKVNPEALANLNPSRAGAPGTYAFYEQMRQENPKMYNSPRVQLQMHKEAMEKGEAFFQR